MRKVSIVSLFICITALTVGCRVAFIIVEGGEIQYEDSQDVLHTCEEGNVCIVDLKWGGKVDDDEIFVAIPASGWYFHQWNAGKRFLFGNSALPECHLDFEWIEDNPDFPEIFESAGLFYLMPVFKDYPRVTLGAVPRTITADGVKQEWLQPADFIDYSYEQIAKICPNGVCSGTVPGGSIDLTGYFWASSEEVSLLFLAYQQANKFGTDDFERTGTSWPYDDAVAGILYGRPLLPGEPFNCGIAAGNTYETGYDGHANYFCHSSIENSSIGFWFWPDIERLSPAISYFL
jgi:hypothetical protein